MSRMVSRVEMRNMVIRRADIDGETDESNGRFPVSLLNDEINRSVALYHNMLTDLRGADYNEKLYMPLGAVTKSHGGAPDVTFSGVPAYEMTVVLTVTTGGALATAAVSVAVNGSVAASFTTPASAAVETPVGNTGLTVRFAAGTYVLGRTYTVSTTQFETQPNVGTYVLPADFFQLTMVEAKISGVHVPLERFNRNQRPWLRDVNTWFGYDAIPMYRLRGDGRFKDSHFIEFSPRPAAAYELDIWYVPQPAAYTSDAAPGVWELPFDSGGEEWVALDVAIKLMLMDNLDTRAHGARMAKVEADIRKVFAARDNAMPERVVDRSESTGLGHWPWRV